MQTPDSPPPSFPGQPVEPSAAPSNPYSSSPGYGQPPTSGPPPKKSKVVPILIGCGCVLPLLCVVGLIALGFILQKSGYKSGSSTTTTTSTSNGTGDYSLGKYVGQWTATDGTTLWIRSDGKGDYKAGSSNVTGGTVTIDPDLKTLSVKFLMIGPTWKIDSPPRAKDGKMQMNLGGTLFVKTGGVNAPADDSPTSSTPAPSEDPNFDASSPPSTEQQKNMADEAMRQLDEAFKNNDFTDFHSFISSEWKEQASPEDLRNSYKSLVAQNIPFSETYEVDPAFAPPASLNDEGNLVLQGFYPAKSSAVFFKFTYTVEDTSWKMKAAQLSLGKPVS